MNTVDKYCPDCGTIKSPVAVDTTQPQIVSPPTQPEYTPPTQPEYTPSTQPEYTPPTQPEYPQYPGHISPQKPKSLKWLWISLISLAAVVIAASVIYFTFFRNVLPILSLGRAFANLSSEVEERINSTPFKALPMLPDILEDGALTADFTYSASLFGTMLTADIDGRIDLISNTKTREFAIDAHVGAYGQSLDFDIHMNRERMAMRLRLIGDDYYGIKYDTFRNDIRVLGSQIMLDTQTMDMLSDVIDQINTIMNAEETDDELIKIYTDILRKFTENIKINSSRTSLDNRNRHINCRLIEITVSKDDILTLLNEYNSIYETNEAVRSQIDAVLNNPILVGIFGDHSNNSGRSEMDFNDFINEFERNYSGEIKISFFIDRNDRLLRMVINSDTVINGENSEIRATFDFGITKDDEWIFSIYSTRNNQIDGSMIRWSLEERSGTFINTIDITTSDMDSTTLISELNTDTSAFALTFIDTTESNTITGVFITDDINFHITIDDMFPNDPHISLTIGLSTGLAVQTGTHAGEISFINIDRWGSTLIEAITRLLILGSLF